MDLTGDLQSQFLEGSIRHRRLSPVSHAFTYPIGLYCVNLAEWDRLDGLARGFSTRKPNWVWLRRRDYFAPGLGELDSAVRRHVQRATGWFPDSRVDLVTHPRYLGYSFNPVSFYFCHDAAETSSDNPVPRVILAQITNTPWNERHTYCLEAGSIHEGTNGWRTLRFRFAKEFHVSPYNTLAQVYDWFFSFRRSELRIHMNVLEKGTKRLDATLVLRRMPLTSQMMAESIKRYPLESAKGIMRIYWNALRLKLKGAGLHGHPEWNPKAGECAEVPPMVGGGKVTSWKI